MVPSSPLNRFPRPSVAVDLAVLTVVDDALRVVLQRPTDSPSEPPDLALPGRFIRERQTVAETVDAVLTEKLGLPPAAAPPLLLRVFDDPDRDPRGWTLSLAYALTLASEDLADVVGELVEVDHEGGVAVDLPFDHAEIVSEAVARLRARYEAAPDPDGLLRPPATLSALRRLHEAVLGEPLRKDTFNRRMRDSLDGLVDDETEQPLLARESVGRPAQMFTWSAPPTPAPYPPAAALPRDDKAGSRGRRFRKD